MTLDDFLADPQAKASATDSFRREERFEKVSQNIARHTTARIGDGQGHTFLSCAPATRLMSAQEESATLRMRRIDGIRD